MALPRQMVDMPFSKGLNTKQDPFQIPLGDLLVLQNAVFTAPGKLRTRNGYAAMVQSILGGGSIVNPTALFARANELLQIGGTASQTLYSYDASNTAWAAKGTMPSVGVSVASVAQAQFSTLAVDMAQATNGLQCFVFELFDTNAASKKGVWYTLYDPTTGQTVVPPTVIDATSISANPHVVAFGNTFVCYYAQGDFSTTSGLFGRSLSATAPLSGWSASTQLTSGTTTSAQRLTSSIFDVIVSGTNAFLSFNNRSNTATIFKVTSASPFVVAANVVVAVVNTPQQTTVVPDLNGNIAFAVNDGTIPKAAVYDSTLASVLALTALDGATSGLSVIAGVSTAAGVLQFFFAASTSNDAASIRTNTLTLSGAYVAGTAADVVRSLGIAARPFVVGGRALLPAWYSPDATSFGSFARVKSPQNTIFVVDANGVAVGKALAGTAAAYDGISATNFTGFAYQFPNSLVSGSTAMFPAAASSLIKSIAGLGGTVPVSPFTTLANYQYGAAAISLNFADATNGYQRAQLANSVFVNGGVLQMYDGQNVVEQGFMTYPSFVGATPVASGGALSAGTYSYIAVYSWMDGQGQFHRSVPSVAVSATVVLNGSVTLVVPTLRVTSKTGVMVDIYRTLANGTVYFQITNFNATNSLYNNKSADTVGMTDTLSDASIAGNPHLYTTGGVLQNDAPPPCSAMAVHRNRLFVVDEYGAIWYSKQVITPAPVEFSGFQKLNIDPKGGNATALASLDDKLIVFKADRVFMVLGQGPDATGGQNDFTDAISVSTDTGCSVPKSVVVAPDGIMYQSPKGIYLLDRALNVKYIGAAVEGILPTGLTFQSVNSASVLTTVNQVRFGTPILAATGSPLALEYDYAVGQWGETWIGNVDLIQSDASCIDSCVVRGQFYVLTDSAGVVQESIGSTVDSVFGGETVQLSLSTGWIKLGGLLGFQRACKFLILGVGGGRLRVKVAYDEDDTIAQTTIVPITFAPNGAFQARIDFARQKCSSFRLWITDLDGLIFSLSGISMEIAVKPGANRLPASKSFG